MAFATKTTSLRSIPEGALLRDWGISGSCVGVNPGSSTAASALALGLWFGLITLTTLTSCPGCRKSGSLWLGLSALVLREMSAISALYKVKT